MPMMSRRLDEDDEELLPPRRSSEREMTLGTGAILGIFFGLVVLVGASIGFGYKLGSTARATTALPATDTSAPIVTSSTSPSSNAFKPAAGSPAVAANGLTVPGIVIRQDGAPVLTTPSGGVSGAKAHSVEAASAPTAASPTSAGSPPYLARTPSPAPLSSSAAALPAAAANGSFVVQVAAVSHQEDADLLVNALLAKGYAVAARSEGGDRLVHIQVGPFSDRKEADAMKARLTADGYNAYIK